jgi:hypothetical protein
MSPLSEERLQSRPLPKYVYLGLSLLFASILYCIWNESRILSAHYFLRHRRLVSSSNLTSSRSIFREVDRRLQSNFPVNVTINLELFYMNQTLADLLGPQETPQNNASLHFCSAVNQQVWMNCCGSTALLRLYLTYAFLLTAFLVA